MYFYTPQQLILIISLLLLTIVGLCSSEITTTEQNALEKFRPMVQNIIDADVKDRMSQDKYLIRWLRSNKLDLNAAKDALSKAMKWRKDSKINDITREDFSKFKKDYPVYIDGFDKEGRPVVTYLFGQYDLRKVSVGGELDGFKRYLDQIFESTEQAINSKAGANVTDAITIFDLSGFNARQHLCLSCLGIYTYYVQTREANFPNLSHKIYLINMPPVFEDVLRVIRPLFSEHTRSAMEFYGFDKEEWKAALRQQIDRNQLFGIFGGSKMIRRDQTLIQ